MAPPEALPKVVGLFLVPSPHFQASVVGSGWINYESFSLIYKTTAHARAAAGENIDCNGSAGGAAQSCWTISGPFAPD